MVNLPATNKAPTALAVEILGGLAAWAVISGASGFWGYLANTIKIAALSSFAVGIHCSCKLTKDDYFESIGLASECLTLGYRQSGMQNILAPTVEAIAELPGIDNFTSKVPFDISDVVEQSAMVIAPTGTGKSFLLSLIMCERQRLHPNAPWKICSINNWKRGQTWMGLKECPQWLQDKYLGFGNKYSAESDVTTATHRETDDAIDALFAELKSRQRKVQESKGDCGKFELCTLVVDEFPVYWKWVNDDRKAKIMELLTTGHGYQCLLWVVAVDDAVGMIGLNQAEKKQLMMLRPMKPGEMGKGAGLRDAELAIANTLTCRRLYVRWDGDGKVMPIPHCETEPEMDWSVAIAQGEFYSWLDNYRAIIAQTKAKGQSMTKVWQTIISAENFPSSGNKRQGDDNEHYRYFKKVWERI